MSIISKLIVKNLESNSALASNSQLEGVNNDKSRNFITLFIN